MDQNTAGDWSRLAAGASRAEQFSIWAMRLWWRGFPELDAAWPDLVAGFRTCGVASAVESCHRFCSIALAAAQCGGGVACLHCPRIAPVEEKLLEALTAASSGDEEMTQVYLRQVMSASAARLAAPHAVKFARLLTGGGLQWPAMPADEPAWPSQLQAADIAGSSTRLH